MHPWDGIKEGVTSALLMYVHCILNQADVTCMARW